MAAPLFIALLWLSVYMPLPCAASPYTEPSNGFGPLKFTPNGTFHIAIFEDLHLVRVRIVTPFPVASDTQVLTHTSAWGPSNTWADTGAANDLLSLTVMNETLAIEQPDFVVLNGDLISGQNALAENATVFINMIVGPLLDRNLTWASTYGNHDSDFNLSRSAILQTEQKWPHCRTTSMVADEKAGVSNYYLAVYASNCSVAALCAPELIL